jgi:hypothetical protein
MKWRSERSNTASERRRFRSVLSAAAYRGPASTIAMTLDISSPLLGQNLFHPLRCVGVTARPEVSEWQDPRLAAVQTEMCPQRLTRDIGNRRLTPLRFALDEQREIVGEGDRGASHTRIIAQRQAWVVRSSTLILPHSIQGSRSRLASGTPRTSPSPPTGQAGREPPDGGHGHVSVPAVARRRNAAVGLRGGIRVSVQVNRLE